MRLLYSKFFGLKSMSADLNEWKFFVVPINMMSNITVLFTIAQIALNVWCILTFSMSEDVWLLAVFGIALNGLLGLI